MMAGKGQVEVEVAMVRPDGVNMYYQRLSTCCMSHMSGGSWKDWSYIKHRHALGQMKDLDQRCHAEWNIWTNIGQTAMKAGTYIQEDCNYTTATNWRLPGKQSVSKRASEMSLTKNKDSDLFICLFVAALFLLQLWSIMMLPWKRSNERGVMSRQSELGVLNV